jgi:hypothetical protein
MPAVFSEVLAGKEKRLSLVAVCVAGALEPSLEQYENRCSNSQCDSLVEVS